MKKVLVFGTFDILHEGHKYFLKKAKKHGNYLIVVIARDSTVEKVKNKTPKNNENERLKNIQKLDFVDKAVLGNLEDKYSIIKKIKPDIICLGYDQTYFTENLENKLKEMRMECKIIRLKAYKPEIYKSSLINNK